MFLMNASEQQSQQLLRHGTASQQHGAHCWQHRAAVGGCADSGCDGEMIALATLSSRLSEPDATSDAWSDMFAFCECMVVLLIAYSVVRTVHCQASHYVECKGTRKSVPWL